VPWQKNKWGKLCSYTIKNSDEIDYGVFLIKQVYEKLLQIKGFFKKRKKLKRLE